MSSNLPSHASRDICQRQRAEMRQLRDEGYVPASDTAARWIDWLLAECHELEREYESMAADARHWRERCAEAEAPIEDAYERGLVDAQKIAERYWDWPGGVGDTDAEKIVRTIESLRRRPS